MTPTPFTTALPKLAALIDDERPLISAALLDVVVTNITDEVVMAEVATQHSFEILTTSSQHDYLNRALSKHWEKNASFALILNIPSTPSPESIQSPGPKRTSNTLTFTERAALQNWMNQPENQQFTANESDNDAARQATKDLGAMVKAVVGHEGDCEPAFPGLIITAGNIASMRKILGIEKVKPAKPAPAPTHDIDLIILTQRVNRHGEMLHNAAIDARNTTDAIAQLRDLVDKLTSSLASLDKTVIELRGPIEDIDSRLKSLESSND